MTRREWRRHGDAARDRQRDESRPQVVRRTTVNVTDRAMNDNPRSHQSVPDDNTFADEASMVGARK